MIELTKKQPMEVPGFKVILVEVNLGSIVVQVNGAEHTWVIGEKVLEKYLLSHVRWSSMGTVVVFTEVE